MNKLILMVGLPRSGKTTEALKMGHPIVSPDAVRLALHGEAYIQSAEPYVHAITRTMVHALFIAGHNAVVVDACHNTRKRRNEWKSNEWIRRCVVIDTARATCAVRASSISDAKVRNSILHSIDRMAAAHEPIDSSTDED
jgi:predicted kinase